MNDRHISSRVLSPPCKCIKQKLVLSKLCFSAHIYICVYLDAYNICDWIFENRP